jgi:hypothetical protein
MMPRSVLDSRNAHEHAFSTGRAGKVVLGGSLRLELQP